MLIENAKTVKTEENYDYCIETGLFTANDR